MTVANQGTWFQYLANSATTAFSFPNKIFQATDLAITLIAGNETAAQLNYVFAYVSGNTFQNTVLGLTATVSNVDVDSGALVTFSAAPTTGFTVDLRTDTPDTQSTSIKNQGQYLPDIIEEAFDRATRIVQDALRLTYTFGIHGPDNESIPWPAFPPPAQRLGLTVMMDPVQGLPTLGTPVSQMITAALVGQFIFPPLAVEGSYPVALQYPYGNVLRYGIVPNNSGAATSNAQILSGLLNPTTLSYSGKIDFPNTTGQDVYSFACTSATTIQMQGVQWELNDCTLAFSGTYDPTWNGIAFIRFIRDVTIENGSISVNFITTTESNSGMAILIGSRSGYPFGRWPAGIFDQDNLVGATPPLPPMGNSAVRNVRFTSNNPSSSGPPGIVMILGGLRGVDVSNNWFNGQGVIESGVYYEFGFASTNGQPGNQALWTSSHMCASRFKDNVCTNMLTTGSTGSGISLVGAHNCVIDGLIVDSAVNLFTYNPGEALNYRQWIPTDAEGGKRGIQVRRVVGTNLSGIGLVLAGSESSAGGYLSGAGLTSAQQTELMEFDVDGFALNAAGAGISVTGPCSIRNGICDSATGSGIIISDDCITFSIDRVKLLNAASSGLKGFASGIWPTPRLKMGTVKNSLFANNTSIGANMVNCQYVKFTACQFGYALLRDGVAETVQTIGINCTGGGVYAEGCFGATPSGSGHVYNNSGTLTNSCSIQAPQGEVTIGGTWDLNYVAQATSTVIGSAASVVNTVNKYAGREANDVSNHRIMVAIGPNPTDAWWVADGSTSVTPS